MSVEKSVKLSGVNQNGGREKLLIFELDQVLVNANDINWQMAAVAWAAQKNGYDLAIVSSRSPQQFLNGLLSNWDNKNDAKKNIQKLIEVFSKTSISGALSFLQIFGLKFEHNLPEQQKTFEAQVLKYLQQCLMNPQVFDSKYFISLVSQNSFKSEINPQIELITQKYQKSFIEPFCFISHSKNDINAFDKELKIDKCIKRSYLYNGISKEASKVRTQILSELSLQDSVIRDFKQLSSLIGKGHVKNSTELYSYFWATHAIADASNGPAPKENQIVNGMIHLWNGSPRFLTTLLRIRYPSYTHQYFLKLIYDVYPFKEADKPYHTPDLHFEPIDQKEKRGQIAKVGFEEEEILHNSLTNILNNNDQPVSSSAGQHYHYPRLPS